MRRTLIDVEVWMEEHLPMWTPSPFFPEWWRGVFAKPHPNAHWNRLGVTLCRAFGHGKIGHGMTGHEGGGIPMDYTYCERCGDEW